MKPDHPDGGLRQFRRAADRTRGAEIHQRLIDYVLRLASGAERTCAERHGVREMCIFKTGVTL